MEVILIKDVDNIGRAGSVIKVKDGFARNFLLPRKFAVLVTSSNLRRIEEEKKKATNLKQEAKEKSIELGSRLDEVSITLPVAVHDEDKLYGGISAIDIIEALKQEGISGIDKDSVILDEPIKELGVYDIAIRLESEVAAKIKVWIVKK